MNMSQWLGVSISRRWWMALWCSVLFAARLFAQIDNGTIIGTVQDASGAVVPSADITVTNNATGVVVHLKTNADGTYQALALNPGSYSVTVAAVGLAGQRMDKVEVHVQSRVQVDFVLRVGQVQQQIQVTTAEPLLQTQSADVGGVVESRQIQDLPLNGRRYSDLALLSAGVFKAPDTEVANSAPDRFSSNGNLETQNYFSLDGIDNNSYSTNLQEGSVQNVQPPPDALQEFRLQTRTYSTEFGTSAGAVVNASIRSGTNSFKGDVWEFVRNNALDANTYFNNRNKVQKGHFSQNQFGGAIGGPIFRNRTFFFADYQGLLSTKDTTQYAIVPSALMRQGNFTELNSSVYKLTASASGQSGCIVNNVIQSTCIDPVGAKLAALFPDPNIGGAWTGASNYQSVYAVPTNVQQTDGRIDHTLNASNQIFGRYSYMRIKRQDPPWTSNFIAGNGNFATQYNIRNQSLALGWTDSFSSTAVNQAHFGFLREYAHSDPLGLQLGTSAAGNYGLTGIPVTAEAAGIPPIYISGFTTLGTAPWRPQFQIAQVWQFLDTFNKLLGKHSLIFGYEFHQIADNFFDIQAPQGVIFSNGIYSNHSGFGLADFLLGDTDEAIYENALTVHSYLPGNSFFVQDNWRATSSLTLTYGLRYELYPPQLNRTNAVSNFSAAQGGSLISSSSSAGGWYERSLIHPDMTNFSPRIGFAYRAFPSVVLRGGYGIFHQFLNRIGSESQLGMNPPFLKDVVVTQQLGSTTPVFQLKNGFPASLSTATVGLSSLQIRAQDPNQRTSYVEQASFGPQIQISNNTTAEITWVGNWGRKMNRLRNANQGVVTGYSAGSPLVTFPYANLNTIQQSLKGSGQHSYLELATNDGNTDYEALELSLHRNLANRIGYQLSYTWSHNMAGYADNLTATSVPQNAYDYAHEMSNSPFDQRHRFVANALWVLPVGKGGLFLKDGRTLSSLLGNWQFNTIVALQTGIPFNVTASDNSFTGSNHASYPDCIGDAFAGATTDPQKYTGSNAPGFYINPNAFSTPAAGLFGSCRPRSFHGPGLENIDFNISKQFALGGDRVVEIRSEFFNAFNHANFANPSANISNPASVGKVTSTVGDPREIQFAAKLYF